MKASELKEKTVKELYQKLDELTLEYGKLRMQNATGNLKETHKLKEMRKDIARINTVISSKVSEE